MSFPVNTGPVPQPSASSSALFRASDPVSAQDTTSAGQTPNRQYMADTMATFSLPQPQRTTSSLEIPQTPKTQLIQRYLEQQNFELMNKLQRKNEEKMRDISAQLQTGLQAFLQQSLENMFNCLALALTNPAPQATNAEPHIVSITPLAAAVAATKFEEPMDSTPSQPPAIKKGLAKVKGSSGIASQSLQAVASHIQVTPSASTQATTVSTSAPQIVALPNIAPASSNLQSPLQVLEQEEYGTDNSTSSSFTTPRSEEPTGTSETGSSP